MNLKLLIEFANSDKDDFFFVKCNYDHNFRHGKIDYFEFFLSQSILPLSLFKKKILFSRTDNSKMKRNFLSNLPSRIFFSFFWATNEKWLPWWWFNFERYRLRADVGEISSSICSGGEEENLMIFNIIFLRKICLKEAEKCVIECGKFH